MEDESDENCSVPRVDCEDSFINNNVPIHNDDINQSYIHRDQCVNSYFPVSEWFKLVDRSKCNCHEDQQVVPIVNVNDTYSFPDVIFNHIINYWLSVPASTHLFFPDPIIDSFDDYIFLQSPTSSLDDDNVNNEYDVYQDQTFVEENSEDDTEIFINVDTMLSLTPDSA